MCSCVLAAGWSGTEFHLGRLARGIRESYQKEVLQRERRQPRAGGLLLRLEHLSFTSSPSRDMIWGRNLSSSSALLTTTTKGYNNVPSGLF